MNVTYPWFLRGTVIYLEKKNLFFGDVSFIRYKVHLTFKHFFTLNNSLHLFETDCAFLPHFSPSLDYSLAVKVKNFGYHLFHGRASKGYGSIPGLMPQTSLHACLQRLNTMQISL